MNQNELTLSKDEYSSTQYRVCESQHAKESENKQKNCQAINERSEKMRIAQRTNCFSIIYPLHNLSL